MQTIDQFRDRLLGVTDTLALMLAAFGAVALVLAGIGLYGVISFSVARERGKSGYAWRSERTVQMLCA